jgi:regulator of protease activity HflC (stomatin/prohibitin superfamily)
MIRMNIPTGPAGPNRQQSLEIDTSHIGRILGGIFLAIVLLYIMFHMMFSVNNHEIAALTYPNGTVEYYFTPGVNCQCLGHVQFFEKRTKYSFEEHIQFNDGAHATIKGSVQFQVPQDKSNFGHLYTLYPSPEQISSGLIETNLQKAVYLTGRTMSSKESYAERRGDLLSYMEDQLKHGPYQTHSFTREVPDDLDKTRTKIINVVEIAMDQAGKPLRAEPGLVEQYNIDTTNFNFSVTYDPTVEQQIQSMQQQTQQINQKIAEAKMAEQNAITIAKNGEAEAAQAKWDQEKINAKQIAEAQMRVTVAEQDKEAAALGKQKAILEGEGEAQKRQLILNADGALAQKLATYEKVNQMWATALQNYGGAIVPQIQTGGASGGNGALNFQELMSLKAARDLGLDMGVPSGARAKK